MRGRGPQPLVVLFARCLEPGRLETRLVPALGAREASDLYRAMLLDTIDVARQTGAEVVVAYSAKAGRRLLERLVGAGTRLVPRPPGDLGVTLAAVSKRLLGERRRPALMVVGDSPGIDTELLEQAIDGLRRADVVIGPSPDGGYYLLGVDRYRPELFADIPWESGAVLEATRERAASAGLRVVTLREERGLDTPEDLLEWHAVDRERDLAAYQRTLHALHALLPPRRLSALESELDGG